VDDILAAQAESAVGTTDLLAAMNVATGEVLYDTRRSHAAKDVLAFFKLIDLDVPRDHEIHVVLDNLSAHKAPPVATWLAHPKRARWHLHFTPTSSSWLNVVEGWFSLLTKRRLERGVFASVDHLIEAIETWAERHVDRGTRCRLRLVGPQRSRGLLGRLPLDSSSGCVLR
jgi:transposase